MTSAVGSSGPMDVTVLMATRSPRPPQEIQAQSTVEAVKLAEEIGAQATAPGNSRGQIVDIAA